MSFPRSQLKEILDGPLPDRERLRDNLLDLAWVNRWAGGTAVVLSALELVLGKERPARLRLLDVGTGGADIPVRLVQWGRERGIAVEVDAVDLRPEVVDVAAELARREPAVRVRCGDALSLDVPAGAYDIVLSSLTLHHLSPEEAVRFLASAWRVAGRALIVNDLRRSRLAWLGTRLVSRIFRAPEARHDGPLSVLRAYTPDELTELAERAGLPHALVERRAPFRMRLIARRR